MLAVRLLSGEVLQDGLACSGRGGPPYACSVRRGFMAVSAAAVSDLETVSIVLVGQFQIDEFEPTNLYNLGCIETEELAVVKIPLRFPDAFVIHLPTLRIHAESNK